MPKLNKEIKKHLFYILGFLLLFIASMIGLDKINDFAEKDISVYKAAYEAQKQGAATD